MYGFQSSAARKLAGPQRLADGGLIRSLFGGGPKETVSEKFARQDAELKAKMAAKAPAPAPAPAADSSVAGSYGAVNVLQRREKAAGLANGGPVKAGIIKGPGSGTSDSIPGTMPAGSYVMPADSTEVLVSNGETNFTPEMVQAVGVAALTAARDITHTPVAQQEAEEGETPQFRDGGLVEDTIERGRRVAPFVNHRPYTPPPAPVSTALTAPPPAPYQPNFTMGATTPGAPDPVSDVRTKYNPANGSPEAKAWQAERAAATASPAAAPVAASAPAVPAAEAPGRISQVANRARAAVNSGGMRAAAPLALAGTALATGTTPTEDYERRFGFQPSTSDSPAVRFARDVGVRTLGAASDLGNAMSLGFAGNFYRDKDGQPAAQPAAAPARAPVASPVPQTQTDVQRGGDFGFAPTGADAGGGIRRIDGGSSPLFTNMPGGDPALMARGKISTDNKVAAEMLGDDQYVASLGRVRGQMAKEQYDREVAQAQATNQWVADRFGAPDRLQRNARRLRMEEQRSAAQTANEATRTQNEVARTANDTARLGFQSRTAAADAASKNVQTESAQQILAAQSRLAAARTPEERAAAEDTLRALQGKYEKTTPDLFDRVQTGVDPRTGTPIFGIYSKRTGQMAEPAVGTAALPPKDKLVKGQTYQTPRGTAVWDGTKFTLQ